MVVPERVPYSHGCRTPKWYTTATLATVGQVVVAERVPYYHFGTGAVLPLRGYRSASGCLRAACREMKQVTIDTADIVQPNTIHPVEPKKNQPDAATVAPSAVPAQLR